MKAVTEQIMENREAGRNADIPERNFRRRLVSNDYGKHQLSPSSC
jgi:hypothetical protein